MGLREAILFAAGAAADAMCHRTGELAEFDRMVAGEGVAAALAWLRTGTVIADEHWETAGDG